MVDIVEAAGEGDLARVRHLVEQDGADVSQTGLGTRSLGLTALLFAAKNGKWKVVEYLVIYGRARGVEDGSPEINGAFGHALYRGFPKVALWLLVFGGARITAPSLFGDTTRDKIQWCGFLHVWGYRNPRGLTFPIHGTDADVSSLLKVMVMLHDAPSIFIERLRPHDAEIATKGLMYRKHLAQYLEQQKSTIIEDCDLPLVLLNLIVDFAATTTEDMWEHGLPGFQTGRHPMKRRKLK
jgi:hypothetical protein